MFKITINNNECIRCMACVAQCPSNFEMRGNTITVKKEQVKKLGDNKDAEDTCPVQAIQIVQV